MIKSLLNNSAYVLAAALTPPPAPKHANKSKTLGSKKDSRVGNHNGRARKHGKNG